MSDIHLGFEIPTGEEVSIPLRHMAVTGQTQESGKTTTLEALITRSGLRAVAFITKRGEGAFQSGRQIAPYFEERTDWQFIEAILESTMKQRMAFKQPWIIRACDGTRTLADVQQRAIDLMEKSRPGMNQDMYMLLNEYLKIVVPLIKRLPKSSRIDLKPGLNVMNLGDYPEELQQLVIASTLRWIHLNESGVVIIVPEAWQFVPQGKKTPVKNEVINIARLGAGLKNYLWVDSQDMAGVEKTVLRACPVWIIGVQREMNELKRALGNIPAGVKRPKAEDVSRLGLGEFYACWHHHIHRVYVQPSWMDEEDAAAVAMRKRAAVAFSRPLAARSSNTVDTKSKEHDEMTPEQFEQLNGTLQDLAAAVDVLTRRLDGGSPALSQPADRPAVPAEPASNAAPSVGAPVNMEEVYSYVVERLKKDPKLLRLMTLKPEMEVVIERETIKVDGKSLRGRLAALVANGFFDNGATGYAAHQQLLKSAKDPGKANVYKEMDTLAQMGFVTKEADGKYYSVTDMKVRIVE